MTQKIFIFDNKKMSPADDSQMTTNLLTWVKQLFSTIVGTILVIIGSALLLTAAIVGLQYQSTGTFCPTLEISLLLLFATVFFASGGVFFGKGIMQMEPKEIRREFKLGQLYYQFIALVVGIVILLASSVTGIISGSYLYPANGKCASTVTCCMQTSSSSLLAVSGTVLILVFGGVLALCTGCINLFILQFLNLGSEGCCSLKNILWPTKSMEERVQITSFL